MLLTLFALGILLIDLMLPAEWKWVNAADRLGRRSVFCRWSVCKIQAGSERSAGLPGDMRPS